MQKGTRRTREVLPIPRRGRTPAVASHPATLRTPAPSTSTSPRSELDALDDFGTTDASLSALAALDLVELAPVLVDALDRLPRMATIVRSLVQMADCLNALVIAEGVERPGQLDVPHAQGYLLGIPRLPTDTARPSTTV